MEMTVLVEKVKGRKFRASTCYPVALECEEASREEAIHALQERVRQRLARAEVVRIDFPDTSTGNPWLANAGIWKNHPDLAAYLTNVEEYRRSVDSENGET